MPAVPEKANKKRPTFVSWALRAGVLQSLFSVSLLLMLPKKGRTSPLDLGL